MASFPLPPSFPLPCLPPSLSPPSLLPSLLSSLFPPSPLSPFLPLSCLPPSLFLVSLPPSLLSPPCLPLSSLLPSLFTAYLPPFTFSIALSHPPGHLKRFRKGVQELLDMQKSEPATPSPFTQPFNQLNIQSSPSHSMSNLSASSQTLDQVSVTRRDSLAISESDVTPEQARPGGSPGKSEPSESRPRTSSSERPPPVASKPRRTSQHKDEPSSTDLMTTSSSQDSGIESMGAAGQPLRHSSNFAKMKTMLAKRMGISEGGCDEEEEEEEKEATPPPPPPPAETLPPPPPLTEPPPSSPKPQGKGPPPIPKRANSTVLSAAPSKKDESPLVHSQQANELSSTSSVDDTDYNPEVPPPVPVKQSRGRGTCI